MYYKHLTRQYAFDLLLITYKQNHHTSTTKSFLSFCFVPYPNSLLIKKNKIIKRVSE